eukprot:gnl/TRDRNA2_/TRDRNA2_136826_c0_seq3.p1 gnl/TRDRNA2_/TRDRNA2_136826_c0~~gnl/TRDRNA2_/TRDRNA2_136826_c0_seq3.p1  ORF type:complete len:340 (-),score=45.75 gnl/TRDRNA2_/TRDRNA2_136826_c0_seq3:55-1074(-)
MLVETFESRYKQVLNGSCSEDKNDGTGCTKLWDITDSSSVFVSGIENFTILIDHTVQQQELGIFKTAREMTGYLMVNGTTSLQQELCASREDAKDSAWYGNPTQKAPCYIRRDSVNDGLEVFRLDTLLKAMGLDLDTASFRGSNHSLRYEGMIVTLQIQYFNTWPWHGLIGEVSYIYNLVPVAKNPYKSTDLVWTNYPTSRTKRDMHGILLSAVGAGRLGGFSATNLLVQLTTSLTLLAISSFLVTSLAIYVLKHRPYYKELLYQTSVDFSDVRELEGKPTQEINSLLQGRNLSTGGSLECRIMRLLEDGWASSQPTSYINDPFILQARRSRDESEMRG